MLSAVVISLGLCVPAWSAAQFCCTQSHRAPTAGGGRQVITQAQCSFTHTYTQNSFPVWLFPRQKKQRSSFFLFRCECIHNCLPPFYSLSSARHMKCNLYLGLSVSWLWSFPTFRIITSLKLFFLQSCIGREPTWMPTRRSEILDESAQQGGGGREWVWRSCVTKCWEENFPCNVGVFLRSFVCCSKGSRDLRMKNVSGKLTDLLYYLEFQVSRSILRS